METLVVSFKIAAAKLTIEKPSVRDMTWDGANQNFWCYFCQKDVEKHKHKMMALGECVVEHGGMLEHIIRDDHIENTTKFLKENKLDLKRTPEFIISKEVFLKYLESTEAVCSDFFLKKSQILNKMAAQIRTQSSLRHGVVSSGLLEQNLRQQEKQQQFIHEASENTRRSCNKIVSDDGERGKKTVQAFGEGLTAIDRSGEDDSIGNIYSDAVPPWMQPDDNEDSVSGIIGPTVDDLEKHRKLERKRQLPACRVGAKFNHKTEHSETWLPDFGGVWSHGRRTNSAQQFHRRKNRDVRFKPSRSPVSSPAAIISDSLSSSSSSNTALYYRPEIPRTTCTVNSLDAVAHPVNSFNNHSTSDVAQPVTSSVTHFFPRSFSTQVPGCSHSATELDITDSASVHSSEMTSVSEMHKPDPAFVDTNTLLTLKPYVRKRKSAAFTESEKSLSSAAFHSSKVYPHTVGHANMGHASTSVFESQFSISQSWSSQPTYPPESVIVSGVTNGRGELNLNPVGYQRKRKVGNDSGPSHSGRDLGQKSSFPVRLLETPVLNQAKR